MSNASVKAGTHLNFAYFAFFRIHADWGLQLAKRNEFVEYLLEQLAPLGTLRAKSMFGGLGLYADELFFAIVVDDVLYVKVDEHNRAKFEALQLQAFRYSMKDGRMMSMSYYPLPESALEDASELIQWAREGVATALRAPERKKKNKSEN